MQIESQSLTPEQEIKLYRIKRQSNHLSEDAVKHWLIEAIEEYMLQNNEISFKFKQQLEKEV